MANVKNFGLIGVGANVQFSKGGSRIINNAGIFEFRNAAGAADVAITTAGITSSSGNVTLTTGNLVLSGSAGTLSVGGDTSLSRLAAGVFQFDGTAAMVLPTGTTGQRPAFATTTGGVRYNSTTSGMEYSDGTQWVQLATGGVAVTAVSVASANGLAGTSSGGTTPTLTLSTTVTGILKGNGTAISAAVSGTDLKTVGGNTIIGAGDVGTIGPTYGGTGLSTFGTGTVLYASAPNVWSAAVPGVTSGVQPYDTDLSALAATTTTGVYVVTGSGTSATRSLVAPVAGITITNPAGLAGDPTFALSDDLAALEGLATTGYGVRTGTSTWTTRSITGTAGRTVVTDGNGVASDTNIDLATVGTAAASGFYKFSTDAYGRVPTTTAVTTADITALVDNTYVNVTGDSMSGNLTFTGGAFITGLPTPTGDTDAANKAYVDAATQGLNVHAAVEAATTAPLTGTYVAGTAGLPNAGGAGLGVGATFTTSGTLTLLDGVTLVGGGTQRVLIKNQATTTQNGIYVVTSVGATTVFTRASDFNNSTAGQVTAGDLVFVSGGTINDSTSWVQTETGTGVPAGTIIIGTEPILWTQFAGAGSYTADASTGIILTGNQFSLVLGAGIAPNPASEVGIDLFNAASGGLILTTDGTTRSTASASKLQLLLPAGSGLTQDATGLYVPASGITNAMLANSTVGLNADAGTSTLALGQTLLVAGTSTQGINTSVSGQTVTITAANASASQKGVATFQATEFVVTAGNVQIGTIANGNLANSSITFTGTTGSDAVALGESMAIIGADSAISTVMGTNSLTIQLNTVDVAHGGTGSTTLVANQLLFGAGTSPVGQDSDLTFVAATNTLTVGTATLAGTAGGPVTLTATALNSDINLVPNGTGAVIIGPAGAGLIQSDSGQPLTVRGNTFLSLESVTGDTTMILPASTAFKVTVSGPTATQYATGLANEDLVNKYYVDTVAGSAAGDVKAVKATVSLTAASTNIGAALPAGSTILSVKVDVTVADSGSGTLVIGKSGNTSAYMTAAENDTQTVGLYLAETSVTEAASEQVVATCAGGTSGSAVVIVTYMLA